MTDNKIYNSIISREPIAKGLSGDKKYCVKTADGGQLLLRVSSILELDNKKAEYGMMERVYALGVSTSQPVEFGICDGGKNCYSLSSWLDGEDAEKALSHMSESEQYVLGLKAGETLRKIHIQPAPESIADWSERYFTVIDERIDAYHTKGVPFEGREIILNYLKQNRDLLRGRPQCFIHGDYHAHNMMLENGELRIIDFDRYDYGDPWEEFNRIVWSAQLSPHFATGQLRGYFGGDPPLEFFRLLAFYIASNALAAGHWAVLFGEKEIDTAMNQVQDILYWFDNMYNPVPTWYIKDFHVQYSDGIPFKLKAPFDFSFISKYGKVFKVFDEQGSGNISFGVENDGKRYFVKFAGSPMPNYIANRDSGEVDSASAIRLLKAAVPKYTELAHPTLIK